MSTSDSFRRMPLSAPTWLWWAYTLFIVGLCFLASDPTPFLAAAFSFQFWTYAAWRGSKRVTNDSQHQ